MKTSPTVPARYVLAAIAPIVLVFGLAVASADPHRAQRRTVHITFAGVYRVDGPVERDVEVVPAVGDTVNFGTTGDLTVTRVTHDLSDPDAPKTVVGVSTFTASGE